MTDKYFPKVTIVSSVPLRNDRGNGILMKSLFAGWPKEQLSQIYFQVFVPHMPIDSGCHEYRAITLTGRTQRITQTQNSPQYKLFTDSEHNVSKSARYLKFVQKLKRQDRGFEWLWTANEIWMSNSWIGHVLERHLNELQPDIVYALFDKYPITKITTLACEKLNIPLFMHVADDFVMALYQNRPLAFKLQVESRRWFKRAVATASERAAISPPMAEEYSRRYNKPWTWYTTLVDPESYDPSPIESIGSKKLIYAGNLDLGRWQSLNSLALALEQLREEKGIEAKLHIYSPPNQIDQHRYVLDIPHVTELCGWAPPADLPKIFHCADILVHVESFQTEFTEFTKLSFSTKLSQYMMAGRCILALGPRTLGSLNVIQTANAGVVVHENDQRVIMNRLYQILIDSGMRQQLAQNGRNWAIQHVSIKSGRERFRQQIIQAAMGEE